MYDYNELKNNALNPNATQDDINDAALSAKKVDSENQKRAIANVLGARLGIKFLKSIDIKADNLRDLQNKLIPILGVGEDAILDPLWDNDKKVWRTNWIVTTPFGKMRVREGYVEKIV